MGWKLPCKSTPNILEELGASVLAVGLADLVGKYAEQDYEFDRLWSEYLLRTAAPLVPEDRAVFVDIAFDVYDTIGAILLRKDAFWSAKQEVSLPLIGPESRFRRDLLFDDDDFSILEGGVKYEYIPHNFPKWYKFWSEGPFYELKTVAGCVDYVYKNRMTID